MENNEVPRDNSSDSENSEWAVVDEDSSLEWNDEAKYHFRLARSSEDERLGVRPLLANGGNTTDEDSIEVVSDIASDEYVTDNDVIESVDQRDVVDEMQLSDGRTRDASDMVWYRLSEGSTQQETRNTPKANTNKQNALNLSDNWDLVAILLVALIGGFAFGYFCGSRHDEVESTRSLVNKLQQEMKYQQHNLCKAHTLLQHPLRPALKVGETSNRDNSITSTNLQPGLLLSEDPNQTAGALDEVIEFSDMTDGAGIALVAGEASNASPDSPAVASAEEHVENREEDNIVLQENAPGKIQNDALKAGIDKMSSLVTTNEIFLSGDGLTSNLEFLKKIDFSFQVLDSILVKTMPQKDLYKMSNYKFEIQKATQKLVKRIDKSFGKFAKNLIVKLDKSKSGILEKLCKQLPMADKEGNYMNDLPANTVFEECKNKKEDDRKVPKSSPDKKEKERHLVKDAILTATQNDDATQHDVVHSKTRKPKNKNWSGQDSTKIEPRAEEKVKMHTHKEIDGTDLLEKKNTITNNNWQNKEKYKDVQNERKQTVSKQKIKPAFVEETSNNDCNKKRNRNEILSDNLKTPKNPNETIKPDYATNNVSGLWVMKMRDGRAEQRHHDRQSDWLFDRAGSRKCQRGNKDSYSKHSGFKHNSGASNHDRRNKRHWVKNMIPESLVDAAKTAKRAFSDFSDNIKQGACHQR